MKTQLITRVLLATTLLSVASTSFAQTDCTPSLTISTPTCVCDRIDFEFCGQPGCLVGALIGFETGQFDFLGTTFPLAGTIASLGGGLVPPDGSCFTFNCKLPNSPGLEIYTWVFGFNPNASDLRLIGGPLRKITVCDQVPMTADCVVIIDEDTIDNGMQSIEQRAAALGVTSDFLVNDDRPTEVGNPWLRWNTMFPGDLVVLPGGQVDDEGWFALPDNTPFSVTDFAEGTVPQSQLDNIDDVMPLRNPDLAALVGQTCVAVVYDSDISMNYLPIDANLQGARYGRFAFTVIDVILPGTLPESQSNTSLYDLLLRVESPMTATNTFNVTVRDHEPDALEIITASWSNGEVRVIGESDRAPGARMTVSIDGYTLESPMTFVSGSRYEFVGGSPDDLRGQRVTISTEDGGAYNDLVR